MTAAIIAIGTALIPILATAIIAIIKSTKAGNVAAGADTSSANAHIRLNAIGAPSTSQVESGTVPPTAPNKPL